MRKAMLVWAGCGLTALGWFVDSPQANGSFVIATNYNGAVKTTVFDPNGSYTVSALSYQNAISNNTVTGNVVLNGLAVNRATVTPQGKAAAYFTGSAPGHANGWYLKSELSKFNDHENITSNTGQYTGFASASVDKNGNRVGMASAMNNKPPQNPQAGGAYGVVIDPYMVPSGTAFPYSPAVGGSVELDGVGDSGSATFFAVDSYVYTADSVENFVTDNTPLSQALWSLTLSGNGPTVGPASVSVDFELNPLALNEITFPSSYLASLGFYANPTAEAALIDASMDVSITSALTYNPSTGEVDLTTPYSPFPSGTTFTAEGSGVEYSDAAEAVVAGVPEPATGALLASAAGAAMLRRRRQPGASG